MKVVLSTIGKFHTFDLARQLYSRGSLVSIFTGYPWFKLQNEGLPSSLIHTFPWLHAPYMGFPYKHLLGDAIVRGWEYYDRVLFSKHVARNLPDCDVFLGLSSSALEAGLEAKRRGIRYVCDRGSTHIRCQDELLREEHELWDLPYAGIDPRIIDREEKEYDEADLITVPSTFNVESFVGQGVVETKIQKIPYGVDLSRFIKIADPDAERFDVLFVGAVSLQKGVPYLLQAYKKVQHANKKITLVGSIQSKFLEWLNARQLLDETMQLTGALSQSMLKNYMSRSHVMVLPSIQEGLAMVQGQALACGCPVIASENTGARDLFRDGDSGYIVPIRDVDALAERMQALADNQNLQAQMSHNALKNVQNIGGWGQYGRVMHNVMQSLIS